MNRSALPALAFVVGIAGAPSVAAACSCVHERYPLASACERAEVGFTGVVEAVESLEARDEWQPQWRMRIRVIQVIQGTLADIVLMTVGGATSCDLDRAWPVGTLVRVFLRDPQQRHVTHCTHVEGLPDDVAAREDPCTEEVLATERAAVDERMREWDARIARRQRAGAAGCASCAVGTGRASPSLVVATLALLMIAARRRA
ncbi:Hypothetical protein I5071_48800 [Sandaracinus amylolyticus]|nr:Hypothetical protein I5071_48800 [Sandaracinus amylolyticus]